MSKIQLNDVVQFTDNHKYNGCLGIVEDMETVMRVKYFVVVIPIPDVGGERAVVTKDEIKKVGKVDA